jgi:transposase InsO family protein
VKCRFIQQERAHHDVRVLCRVLEISRATFYRWKQEGRLPCEKRDEHLLTHVRIHFKKSGQTYGARRVREALHRQGIHVSRKRVSRLMQAAGMEAVRPKRRIRTTNSKHEFPIAPNILARNFEPAATALNVRWAGDITFIWTDEGWLYLAVILDLTSRRVVGFATSANIDRHLALDALRMASRLRPVALLFHSDRGSTYAATEFRKALTSLGITCSMSDVGECLDNAVIESFNGTIKRELIDRQDWPSHDSAAVAICEYITAWYNPFRFHSSLGYLSPVEYELAVISGRIKLPAFPKNAQVVFPQSPESS